MASSTAAIQFCRECNNMLYPKENANEKTLEFVCKLCPYVEKNVASSCVRVNEIIKTTSQSLEVIPSDLNKDPTLQRTKNVICPGPDCGHEEAVFFRAEVTDSSTRLRLIYICCACGYKWIV